MHDNHLTPFSFRHVTTDSSPYGEFISLSFSVRGLYKILHRQVSIPLRGIHFSIDYIYEIEAGKLFPSPYGEFISLSGFEEFENGLQKYSFPSPYGEFISLSNNIHSIYVVRGNVSIPLRGIHFSIWKASFFGDDSMKFPSPYGEFISLARSFMRIRGIG